MVTYEFSCPLDGSIDVTTQAGAAPATVDCPDCGGVAKRRYSVPQVRFGDGRARRLIAATESTAGEPAVVSAPGVGRGSRPNRVSTDPRTARLPRPE